MKVYRCRQGIIAKKKSLELVGEVLRNQVNENKGEGEREKGENK